MKIEVLLIIPCDTLGNFDHHVSEWIDSYTKNYSFPVRISYCCGSPNPHAVSERARLGMVVADVFVTHCSSKGVDIGCYQAAAKDSDADLLICTNTRVVFKEPKLIYRLIEALDRFGDKGLYGTSGSFEACPLRPADRPNLHMRSTCFATSPAMLRRYPFKIECRHDAYMFESGDWNFGHWYLDHGWPVKVVTKNHILELNDCRKIKNGFRQGDQSEMLVGDKYTRLYEQATAEEKRKLEAIADGRAG